MNILVFFALTTNIAGLVWARFRFFKVSNTSSKKSTYFYDPAVAIQIITPYYYLFSKGQLGEAQSVIFVVLYCAGFALFWWSIFTATALDFAFSSNVGKLITKGPFNIVRHPFYSSYSLLWIGNTILVNSIYLWFTVFYLMAFYLSSARSEEKAIEKSAHSIEYAIYKTKVGMFLPRIKIWKS